MLDYFYSFADAYTRFHANKKTVKCENLVSLAKVNKETGPDCRIMLRLDQQGQVIQSYVIEDDDDIVVWKFSKYATTRFRVHKEKFADFVGTYQQIVNTFENSDYTLPNDHPVRAVLQRLEILQTNKTLYDAAIAAANETATNYLKSKETTLESLRVDIVFDIDGGGDVQKSLSDVAQRYVDMTQSVCNNSIVDLFGNSGELQTETFIDVYNKFPIYQRDASVQSFASYGKNTVDACPLSALSRKKIYDVAFWIFDEKNRRKFWNRRTSDKQSDIVVAVPDIANSAIIDEVASCCASILGEEDDIFKNVDASTTGSETYEDAGESVERFAKKSASATEALAGLIRNEPFASFRGMIITRNGTKGAFRVTTHLEFSAEQLRQSLEWWNECATNAVRARFPRFSKGKFVGFWTNMPVHPFQLPKILNINWTRGSGVTSDGEFIPKYCENITLNRFTQHDAISFFLNRDKRVADRIIKQFVEHASWLMLDVSKRNKRGDKEILQAQRFDVLRFPAIIEAALSAKGMNKMEREKNVGYLVGQMLGVADYLHAARYCIRNESKLPTELIGSRYTTLFSGRYRTNEAMRQFGREMRFITDWCKTLMYNRKHHDVDSKVIDDAVLKYKWFEKLMSQVGERMPERLSNEDAASLTLGYYSVRAFSRYRNEEVAS